jgi:hypothetical protein
MTSFAHAEAGDTAYAQYLGRRALGLDRACPLGVHAVAHAFAESGQHREGARWMRQQHEHWLTKSRMCTHNAWHLAIFELEGGDRFSALDIFDRWLQPASRDSAVDACDATALLWRLDLEGVNVSERWHRLSDAFDRIAAGFWPFIDLHAGIAHSRANQFMRVCKLERDVRRCAQGRNYAALRSQKITLPGLAAIVAHSQGQVEKAGRIFSTLRPLLAEAGGSKAQLATFYDFGGGLATRRTRAAARIASGDSPAISVV